MTTIAVLPRRQTAAPYRAATPLAVVPGPRVVVGAAVVLQASQVARDYGHIRYAEATGSPPVALLAGEKTPFVFAIDPTQTMDYLQPPFAGKLSFNGTMITPRALGDGLFVEVNLLVTSSIAGGFLRLEIDVGSSLGPVLGVGLPLTMPAGQQERLTFPATFIQTLASFMANGGKLFVTSTVPVSLLSEALILIPHTAALGS